MPDQEKIHQVLDKVEEIMTRNQVSERGQVVVCAYLLGALEEMFYHGYNLGCDRARSELKK